MSEVKREFNFPIENTEQLISLVEGLSELEIDMDVDSTPSTISISIYGSKEKVEKNSGKIRELVEESRGSS